MARERMPAFSDFGEGRHFLTFELQIRKLDFDGNIKRAACATATILAMTIARRTYLTVIAQPDGATETSPGFRHIPSDLPRSTTQDGICPIVRRIGRALPFPETDL